MSAPEEPRPIDYPLRDGGRITLESRGFRHPEAVRFAGDAFTPYDRITHVAVSSRSLRVGTERSVYVLNRHAFAREGDAEALVGQLARRVAELPDGMARIARMRGIDRTAAQARPQRVTWALLALCAAVQVLQLLSGDRLQEAGAFSATLVRGGELWRLVTANLLHAAPWLPVHFVLNGLALLTLGALLEWTIGSARTALVMGVSGIGAMGASLWVNYEEAVGASGVVMGVFGALVFLELRHGAELPAQWRLPRSIIWMGICLQLILEGLAWAFLPIIATGAHVGGFVSGFLTAAIVGRPGLRREALGTGLRAANALMAVALVASLASVAAAWREGPDWMRRAEILMREKHVPPLALNNAAWLLATAEDPDPEELDAALLLAERAVQESQRRDPSILDTLAEVHFQRGERSQAVEVIEEAIRIDPREAYYLGQRDRFLGRRAPEDRPGPPAPRRPGPGFNRERPGPLDPSMPEIGV